MAKLPNLYIKWRAFREIVGNRPSDAKIGREIWGINPKKGEDTGPSSFAKLKKGEVDCSPEITRAVIDVINRRLEVYRTLKNLGSLSRPLKERDLELPVLTFTQRLLDAAEDVDEATIGRVHEGLLEEITFRPTTHTEIDVQRIAKEVERFPNDFKPSSEPVVFVYGEHMGQFAVPGLSKPPTCVYALCTRDPAPTGHRLWESNWADTVQWAKSPFHPTFSNGRLLLTPRPDPLQDVPGRFFLTMVLIWNEKAIARLDPRGAKPQPGILDEQGTARFLTNLRRMAADRERQKSNGISVAAAEYFIKVP
jgi:hypothetical protein